MSDTARRSRKVNEVNEAEFHSRQWKMKKKKKNLSVSGPLFNQNWLKQKVRDFLTTPKSSPVTKLM